MKNKVISILMVLLVCFFNLESYADKKGVSKSLKADCGNLLEIEMLSLHESFVLQVSNKLYSTGQIPNENQVSLKLVQMSGSKKEEVSLKTVLEKIGLSVDDWRAIQSLSLGPNLVMGTKEFIKAIDKLPSQQKEILRKMHTVADEARDKLKAQLASVEQDLFKQRERLHTEAELSSILAKSIRDPGFSLKSLGYENINLWRTQLLIQNDKLRDKINKQLITVFKKAASDAAMIPESDADVLAMMAPGMSCTPDELNMFFGKQGFYSSVRSFVEIVKVEYPSVFSRVVDQYYFSQKRKEKMLAAIRNATEVVFFKLVENQDLIDFEAAERLAKQYSAPIVVAPAFSEVGLIPTKLKWLFDKPNVHIMVDEGIQVLKDFYVVDPGFEDKRENPLVGLDRIFDPTDRVLVFHPKVRTLVRPTSDYDTHPGLLMTTGSISDFAYWSSFNVGMSTDFRAKHEAKSNRSVTVVSRRYESKKFSDITGAAQGIAPRRVPFTPAHYGNPAGFFDLGKIYSDKGVKTLSFIPAIIPGDIHLGVTDPAAMRAFFDFLVSLNILEKNPKFGEFGELEYRKGSVEVGAIVFHDLIDGTPNNRHMMDSLITRALTDQTGALDLENHVRFAAGWIAQIRKLLPSTNVVVPVDNHGSDWLIKKLQDGDLFKGHRPKEVPLLLSLMLDAIEKKANPYERIFQYYGLDSDRVRFVGPQDTYRIGIDLQNPRKDTIVNGVEIGQHSHMGVSGAKSISLQKLLSAYGSNITGHRHSTEEYGRAKKVGTFTPVKQGYHRGPSNSDASLGLVYSEEAIQVLTLVDGSFLPNAENPQSPDEFFPDSSFPKVMERRRPAGGGTTTDQYRAAPPVRRFRR